MASKSSSHFAAGLASGVVSAALLQPIDLLKTRVQQSGRRSLTQVFKDIAQNGSVFTSLWRGTVPSALRTGLGSALYFTSLNTIRQFAAQSSLWAASAGARAQQRHSSTLPQLSNAGNLLSGAAARAFAGFMLMPLTVIKVRYESSLYSYKSLAHAANDIFLRGGVRGFFAGFGATTIRDAPNAGLYVLFYEQFKKYFSWHGGSLGQTFNRDASASSAVTVNFVSGALAGMSCSVVSNPFDAVKTRIQLRPRDYLNMIQGCKKMVRDEGFKSLWNGLALRMSRKALSSALAWSLYEELIKYAERAARQGR